MANPVPQPNRGAVAGCDSQRLQESGQAPGVQNALPSAPGVGFTSPTTYVSQQLGCSWDSRGRGCFPQASITCKKMT